MTQIPQIADLDTSNWIVIPHEFTDGKYSLAVSPERLAYNSAVERAGEELGLNFANTSRDSLYRGFISGDSGRNLAGSWFEFSKLISSLGKSFPSLEQFNDFGRLLYQGMMGNIPVHDVSGKQLRLKYLKQIYSDTFKLQAPWRAEYIDDFFENREDGLYVLTQNKTIVKKLDENTLMKTISPLTRGPQGISLNDWLDYAHTSQGFPTEKETLGSLTYLPPMRCCCDSVIRFQVFEGGQDIRCNWYPDSIDVMLGIRVAEQLK